MKIRGVVIAGNKRAREIGFPTANIENKAKISTGIFAVRVFYSGHEYLGAAYVGAPQPNILEVHLIDFEENLYGKEIEVEIVAKIRDDIHETNNEKLKTMITADIVKIKSLLYSSDAKQEL